MMRSVTRSAPGRNSSRKSGEIWWVFAVFSLLPALSEQSPLLNPHPDLKMAMMGVDPVLTNILQLPDQGKKLTIFDSYEKEEGGFMSFVQHTKCTPSLNVHVVRNYDEYRMLSSSAISYATSSDAATPSGISHFDFRDNAGYGNLNHPNVIYIRDFFTQHDGEAIFIGTVCVAYTVNILPFEVPLLTYNFLSALQTLNEAAFHTDTEVQKRVFNRFTRSYGTHFARTTHYGYSAFLGKLFETQANGTADAAVRRRCMLESAREVLTPGKRTECETTSQHFSRVVANKCGQNQFDVIVTEAGNVPGKSIGNCDLAAEETLWPVAHILEKISVLFEEPPELEYQQIRLNGTALAKYFEEQLGVHSQGVVNETKMTARNPHFSRCYVNQTRHVEVIESGNLLPSETNTTSCSAFNNGIIIVGGSKTDEELSTRNSLTLFMPSVPELPIGVTGNTVSLVGSKLYSCGSKYDNSIRVCWHTDIGMRDTWHSLSIPWNLKFHSAVTVQDEIWFFTRSKLHILRTKNSVNRFREINLGFQFERHICTVAHGPKVFVVGVGSRKNEIWVNDNSSNPAQWKRFSYLLEGRNYFACLAFGGEIFVTGGLTAEFNVRMSSVEVIDVMGSTVRSTSSLQGVRHNHQMAIINGQPAVIGGYNGNAMTSIETYDERKNSWQTLGYSLSESRHHFGLTQYLERFSITCES